LYARDVDPLMRNGGATCAILCDAIDRVVCRIVVGESQVRLARVPGGSALIDDMEANDRAGYRARR